MAGVNCRFNTTVRRAPSESAEKPMTEKKNVLPAEQVFWVKMPKVTLARASDEEISSKYDSKAERIVTETNREKLQNFYEALKRPNYMNSRPSYQRRQRWSPERQSQLIESFLINIPIPPLFVYESRPNVYEIMDGQQRVTAIKAFYSNELVLDGLQRWPELNGRTYAKLPERIRSGIDRRSISWITVLNESSDSEEDAFDIKQLVFERLNTGGVKLSHQEIRNALYAGSFNDLLTSLSKTQNHRTAWGLPAYSHAEEQYIPESLIGNSFYLEMEDVEVILRFFALRHAQHYSRGMRGFLDLYMTRAKSLSPEDLEVLGRMYESTVDLAIRIFGEALFKPYVRKKDKHEWALGTRPLKAFADAVLVALSEQLDNASILIAQKDRISELTKQLFMEDSAGALTGRANTKADVLDRIGLMRKVFISVTGA
jgi:hypothetical protein